MPGKHPWHDTHAHVKVSANNGDFLGGLGLVGRLVVGIDGGEGELRGGAVVVRIPWGPGTGSERSFGTGEQGECDLFAVCAVCFGRYLESSSAHNRGPRRRRLFPSPLEVMCAFSAPGIFGWPPAFEWCTFRSWRGSLQRTKLQKQQKISATATRTT